MSCDSYLEIGRTHKVCQDYTLHGSFNGTEYVIVADGCSSADYSEVGAQILCHTAKYQIELCIKTGLFKECTIETISSIIGNSVYKRADELRKTYPITRKALEATLLVAIRIHSEVMVFVWGDGVVIANYLKENGDYYQKILDIDYTLNAPFYLICKEEAYLNYCISKGEINPQCYQTTYNLSTEGSLRAVINSPHPYDKIYADKVGSTVGIERLVSITICSDGISSYLDENKKKIGFEITVPEFVGFKHTVGEFVKNRMLFFKKTVIKNNWTHYDDVSCGTIYIDKE